MLLHSHFPSLKRFCLFLGLGGFAYIQTEVQPISFLYALSCVCSSFAPVHFLVHSFPILFSRLFVYLLSLISHLISTSCRVDEVYIILRESRAMFPKVYSTQTVIWA